MPVEKMPLSLCVSTRELGFLGIKSVSSNRIGLYPLFLGHPIMPITVSIHMSPGWSVQYSNHIRVVL